MEAPLSEPFFAKRMKMLNRPEAFMLYGKLGFDFFSNSELLYPNLTIRLRLIRARSNFYMISDNTNVSLGIVDCSFYTRRIELKDDYHKKRLDMFSYTLVEFNSLETLARTIIIPARKKQFIQKNTFNNDPVRPIAIALNINKTLHSLDHTLKIHPGISNLTSDKLEYSEEVSQLKPLITDFDSADNCRPSVAT